MGSVIPFLPSAGVRINASTPAPAAGEVLPLQPAFTLLIALLVPCMLLLFLLNCVLLIYKLPVFNKKRRKKAQSQGRQRSQAGGHNLENGEDGHATGESSTLSQASQELGLASGSTVTQGMDAALALGGGQRSKDGPHSREGLHKPDGTAGEQDACSLRPTIRVTVSATSRLPREQTLGGRGLLSLPGWNQRRGSQGTVSSSDMEIRANQAPPNSPATTPAPRVHRTVQYAQKTSTQRKLRGNQLLIASPLDSVHFENASGIPHDQTAVHISANSSFAGPGLDSDFGASAGVSLRILSSDSDSCSYSWLSGLEWDYYDPGYKRRNQRRIQRHQFPVLCSKQYWV